MCGICGIVGERSQPTWPAALERMNHVIRHRGPDDEGRHLEPGVALGHRRLAIIDLSSAGHQPMTNEDGTLWLTYNGEIYNHREVRHELVAKGHQYRSETDSETIIHAFEEWGEAAVDRFRGMFAFGLWDRGAQRFWLVRDRLGVKPVYYAVAGGTLIFASEIKAILESGLVSANPDPQALPEYLAFGYVSGERTMFAGIRKLPPGAYLTWERGQIRTTQYWDVEFAADRASAGRSEADLTEELRALLDDSVRMRLMSDVPLGVFLSGGLDSSAIAAITAKHVSGQLNTFSVGFEQQYYSELPHARVVARHIGADHHEVILTADDFITALPRLIWHEDEPIWGPPSVALHAVSELASRTVKVVLTGEGSDELFAGYDRYWMTAWNSRFAGMYGALPAFARDAVRAALLRGPLPERARRALGHTPIGRDNTTESLVLDNWFGVFNPEMQRRIGTRELVEMLAGTDVYESHRREFDRGRSTHVVDRMLRTDVKCSLVELLMKQDQMSMATSIESRVPFLDHKLVEFAASVPAGLKIRSHTGKHLLKRSLHGLLPDSIINRPKEGFPVPFDQWLRERFIGEIRSVLLAPDAMTTQWVRPEVAKHLLDAHAAGRENATRQLWNLFSLELWARVFLGGQRWWVDSPREAWREAAGSTTGAPTAVAV
jgi:asparagine synthase (glutamine-hydrolysing)